MQGLALLLNALRARIVLWILLAAAGLVAQATGLGAWPKISPLLTAVIAALLGVIMVYGLGRHLAAGRGAGGRLFGMLALLVFAAVIVVDAVAIAAVLGATPPRVWLDQVGPPFASLLLAELAAFIALAPLTLSHAGFARSLAAMDIRRRSQRAALLVLFATLGVSAVAYLWLRALAAGPVLLVVGFCALLVVLALAKVLGATRFLLAYLQTVDAADATDGLPELRAWHRA